MGGSEDTGCRAGHCDGWPLCGSLPCAKFTDRQYREGAALGARGNAAREAGTLSHPPERQRRARRNGGRAGMPSRDAWDPDTGPLRETGALPYRRFMNDAAMCRNLAFRRHANVDIFGDHAAATVTPDAPPGRGDCFAKKYRLVAATCHNSYKTIQKTIRPPPWRDAEPDAPPGRGDCFAKKYRLVAATCHNSYKTIQKTIRPPPWRDAEPDAPPEGGIVSPRNIVL